MTSLQTTDSASDLSKDALPSQNMEEVAFADAAQSAGSARAEPATVGSSPASACQLLCWLRSCGARVHPAVRVSRDAAGGLGLFVAEPVAAGTELCAVPRASCMLEPPPGMCGHPGLQRVALALLLLKERAKGNASLHASYLTCLPDAQRLAHVPLMWPDGGDLCMALAAASPAGAQLIRTHHALLAAEHAAAVPALLKAHPSLRMPRPARQVADSDASPSSPETSTLQPAATATANRAATAVTPADKDEAFVPPLEEYTWARAILASRSIMLWGGPTLVPLVDFLNHARRPSVVCVCRGGLSRSYVRESTHHDSDDSEAETSCSSRNSNSDDDEPGNSNSSSSSSGANASSSAAGSCVEPDNSTADIKGCSPHMFVAEAIHDISAGSELTWHYNSSSSDADWLMGYGFVPTDGSSTPSVQPLYDATATSSATGADPESTQDALGYTPSCDSGFVAVLVQLGMYDRVLARLKALPNPSVAAGLITLLQRERDVAAQPVRIRAERELPTWHAARARSAAVLVHWPTPAAAGTTSSTPPTIVGPISPMPLPAPGNALAGSTPPKAAAPEPVAPIPEGHSAPGAAGAAAAAH